MDKQHLVDDKLHLDNLEDDNQLADDIHVELDHNFRVLVHKAELVLDIVVDIYFDRLVVVIVLENLELRKKKFTKIYMKNVKQTIYRK